jgi:cupin 2 domain-containing protein
MQCRNASTNWWKNECIPTNLLPFVSREPHSIMTAEPKNMLSALPVNLEKEVSEDILRAKHVRIERIVSQGQSSPEEGWYDQSENEWVMVLEGAGTIAYADGSEVTLRRGDALLIPAHTKHCVAWTEPEMVTIWLAVFFSG